MYVEKRHLEYVGTKYAIQDILELEGELPQIINPITVPIMPKERQISDQNHPISKSPASNTFLFVRVPL